MIEIIRTLDAGETWTYSASYNLSQTDLNTKTSLITNNPTSFWNTKQPILKELIPIITPQMNYKLRHLEETKSHNLNIIFKDFWLLNGSNHIYTTIGNKFQNQKFITNDSQELDDNTRNNF